MPSDTSNDNSPVENPVEKKVDAASTIGDDEASLRQWAGRLDATEEQLRDAIQAVGSDAGAVEDYLKGSRASTNSERVRQAE